MDFSVIIPSRGRSALISDLLESIRHASADYGGKIEVLILDDTPNELERHDIERLCEEYSSRYYYSETPVSEKRNQGACLATFDNLIFLDSDVKVCKDLFREYEKAIRDKGALIAVGALEFYGEDNWYWGVVKASPFTKSFNLPLYYGTVPWGCSCNLFVNRSLFNKFGGFSKDFKYPAGEDVDLGLRISEHHIPIYSAKGAVAYHSKETWSKRKYMIPRAKRYGAADETLVERHPDSVMHMGLRRIDFHIIFCLIAILGLFASGNLCCLLFAPFAILIEILAVSAFYRLNPYNESSYLQIVASYELALRNELAYLSECARRKHFRNFFRQFCSVEGQAVSILETMRFVYLLDFLLITVEIMAITVL